MQQKTLHLLRFMLLAYALLTITFGTSARATEVIKFSDNWPHAMPPSAGHSTGQFFHHSDDDAITGRPLVIYPYFESKNIAPGVIVVFALKPEAPGYELKSNDGSLSDAFYCEEAMWAAQGNLSWAPAVAQDLQSASAGPGPEPIYLQKIHQWQKKSGGRCVFSADTAKRLTTHFACKDLFFEQYPDLKNRVVVMHFIPPSLSSECGINWAELHSLRNLKALRLKELQNPKLNELRAEWLSFIKQSHIPKHYTRQEILNQADFLENKYSSLFVDLAPLSNTTKKLWVDH
jgi:hypothetical protein